MFGKRDLKANIIIIFSPHLTSHPIIYSSHPSFIQNPSSIRPHLSPWTQLFGVWSSCYCSPLQCLSLLIAILIQPVSLPAAALVSITQTFSLLVSAQFQFQRPSQRWSWFNLLATLVSQTCQSPSQWHHNPSSHKFILNNHRTAGRWEGSLFQLNFNTHCKQSWFNLLAT
jgi:hypothetical protein